MRKLVLTLLMLSVSVRAECADWMSYFRFEWPEWLTWGQKASTNPVEENWDKLTDKLGRTLELRDKQETLPKSTWLPFTDNQKRNAERINALLDDAVKILVNGDAHEIRKKAAELRDTLSKQRAEMDSLRNDRITAPEKSSLFWVKTKAKIDEKIARLQEEIAGTERRLSATTEELSSALKEEGLELDPAQTEVLLSTATGEDLMQNASVFANVKAVTLKLEELSQNGTLETIRRYTGIYLVLNDLLIHTQEELIHKIDEECKPKLNEIITEAEALRKDALARSNQKIYTQSQRKAFAANARSNALTIQTAELYRKLLDSQKSGTVKTIKTLKLNRDLAENTYKTVKGSSELRGLIHGGLKVFDALNALTMPELRSFEAGALRVEFEEISRRLKQ